mmetsp:Transcript_1726/g.3300  ORF Transcript_1726/g.3300 Transcript_1726/m.3300 type:complete len:295 (+) Transcript_1726:3289-4173(+)
MRTLGKSGDWGIVAHGVGGLFAGGGHVVDLHGNVLKTPSEALLKTGRLNIIVSSIHVVTRLPNELGLFLQPLSVRMTGRNLRLDLDVVLPLSRQEVDVDHLSWTKAALLDNCSLVEEWDDTSLRHHVNGAVLGPAEPRGTKPVPIQARADALAVAENQKRGTVPCLKESSVEVVEVDDFRIVREGWLILVGSGDEGHEGARRAGTGLAHQLEATVKVGRVTPAQVNERFEGVLGVLRVALLHNFLRAGEVHEVPDVASSVGSVVHTGSLLVHVELGGNGRALGGLPGLHPVDVS